VHAQVATDDGAVLEREQEVLAHRLHPLESMAVDPLGDPQERSPGMRRVRANDVSLKQAKALRRAMDRVAFRHV
jgi:hypothetical protein